MVQFISRHLTYLFFFPFYNKPSQPLSSPSLSPPLFLPLPCDSFSIPPSLLLSCSSFFLSSLLPSFFPVTIIIPTLLLLLLLLLSLVYLVWFRFILIIISAFHLHPYIHTYIHRHHPIAVMPYNTRRKSLSLPSLGIHLPSTSRRSPSISKPSHSDDQMHPPKKAKRSHDSSLLSPEPTLAAMSRIDEEVQLSAIRAAGRRGTLECTPPPSPTDGIVATKIDTEGINDDIVVGVIQQLEKTGNRPHLVKELAAVLVALNDNVAKYVFTIASFR